MRTWFAGLFLLCLAQASPVQAQFNRTFVASTGNDANDCLRSAPCRNFSAAILRTNPGGEIIALDSAGFGPTLNIDKAVSVIAPSGVYAGSTTVSGSAITVNAPGATVVLRGLYLNAVGGSKGVDVIDVGTLHIESCVIAGFQESGVEFHGSGQLLMNDTTSRNNGSSVFTGAGVVVFGVDGSPARASIENCRFERNGSGFLVNNDGGVVARAFSEVTVRHSVISGNTRGCVTNTTVHARMTIEGCAITNNVVGIFASDNASGVIRVSDTVITHNSLFGMEAQGAGQITSRGNNTVIDNAGGETFSGLFAAK